MRLRVEAKEAEVFLKRQKQDVSRQEQAALPAVILRLAKERERAGGEGRETRKRTRG